MLYSWPTAVYKVSRELLRLPNVRPSPYSRRLNGEVECTLCYRRCRLREGGVGVCGIRFNLGKTLYTAAYGLLTTAESRPMEIKPLYHFYPGTSAATISTWGCNFPCAWCQKPLDSVALHTSNIYLQQLKI